ncbi:MAG: DUF4376 domain-containing protein [Rhodocyclaceae bacterium]
MTTIHVFDGPTGVWRATLYPDDAAPYAGRAGYTEQSLPAGWSAGDGRWAVMSEDGVWSLVPDHRGQIWHDPATGDEVRIADVGITPPLEYVQGEAPATLQAQLQAALDNAIAAACAAIDARLEALGHEPIEVARTRWDADERAQRNISGKLADMDQRVTLGLGDIPDDLLMWRDADNVDHAFATQADLRAQLGAIWCAISDRGSRLYQAAWQHKADVRALTDLADVAAYDITEGWL